MSSKPYWIPLIDQKATVQQLLIRNDGSKNRRNHWPWSHFILVSTERISINNSAGWESILLLHTEIAPFHKQYHIYNRPINGFSPSEANYRTKTQQLICSPAIDHDENSKHSFFYLNGSSVRLYASEKKKVNLNLAITSI